MLYNCPNGHVLNMTTEYYLSISDTELDEKCSCHSGMEINDPFYESSIDSGEEEAVIVAIQKTDEEKNYEGN